MGHSTLLCLEGEFVNCLPGEIRPHQTCFATLLFYNICCYCWFGCLSSYTEKAHYSVHRGGGRKKIFTTLIYVHHKAIYTNQMFEKQGTDKEKKTFKRSRRPTRFPNGAPLFATQDSSAQAHRNSRRECLPSTASCETRAGNRKRGQSIGKGNARAVVVAAVIPGVCTLGGGYYGEEMYTRQLLSHLKFGFETGCSEPLHLKLLPYSHKGGVHSSAAARNLVGKRYPPRQHRTKNDGGGGSLHHIPRSLRHQVTPDKPPEEGKQKAKL